MNEPNENLSKFKTSLNILFIRRKREGLNAIDLEGNEFKYIQHHLEDLLPLMSIEETQRINLVFHSAYILLLNNGLRIPNIFPQGSITPDPVVTPDYKQYNQHRIADEESDNIQNQRTVVGDSESYSNRFVTEQTSLQTTYVTQKQKGGPLSQSTPLNAPLMPEPIMLEAQQQEEGATDVFISDIVSHINISPIEPLPLRRPDKQPKAISTLSVGGNEISFLRKFAHIEQEFLHEKPASAKNATGITRKRPNVKTVLTEPKKMMDQIKFETLCCYEHKIRTDEQLKRSEKSFLYFPLIRGEQINITKTTSKSSMESDRRHSAQLKINNLSNILRAHASQLQISVEQPRQINLTRSPLTPQSELRTSFSYTPLRGNLSGLEPRKVLDQVSLQRQQPLLTIHERESSIHIPINQQFEELNMNDPETFSNLLRKDPVNVDMLEEPPIQIEYNEPLLNKTHAPNEIPSTSSIINIPPLTETHLTPRVGVAEDEFSNVPGIVSEDFGMIEPRQPPVHSLTLIGPNDCDTQTPKGMKSTTYDSISLPGVCQEQPTFDQIQLDRSISNESIPLVDVQSNNPPFSWFEILRPRDEFLQYPREFPTNRRKKKKRRRGNSAEGNVQPRRRYELPDMNAHENINEFDAAFEANSEKIPQNQESNILRELNAPLGVDISNQNIQSYENVASDLGDSPPLRSEEHGVSQQVTQYPIPIETELKEYLELIRKAGKKLEYVNWERFDSYLFNESDNFALYTNIFKKILKDDYVAIQALYEQGTSRMEAAKGFRFILDLKTMGVIEIESADTRILGIRLIPAIKTKKF